MALSSRSGMENARGGADRADPPAPKTGIRSRMPNEPLTPETARAVSALAGLVIDAESGDRVARSVSAVTAAAADFQDALAFDDQPSDFARLRRTIAAAARSAGGFHD